MTMLTDLQKRKLMKLFSMYDAGCNGFLVSKDFDKVAQKLSNIAGWSVRSPKCVTLTHQLSQEWRCLKGDADTDRDRKISLDEWFCYYDEMLSDEQKYTERRESLQALIFDVFDHDEDGYLSEAEWGKLLTVYNISPVYTRLIFPLLDTDNDGLLSKTNTLELMRQFFYSDDPAAPGNLIFGPF